MRFLSFSRALCTTALLVGGATLLSVQAAHAQSVSFTLTNFTAATTPNSEAFFYGTITNTSGVNVYLNGLNISQNAGTTPTSGAFVLPADTDPFYNNAPLFLTASGTGSTSTYTGQLFGIKTTALYNTSTSKFFGTATLTGGANSSSSATLGTQNFSVVAAPEPSAIALVGLGLAGIPVLRRRIKNRVA